MTELSAQEITWLQKDWAAVAAAIPSLVSENLRKADSILNKLEKIGLDMEEDATYELLAPDLTKEAFEEQHTRLAMLALIDCYHKAQTLTTIDPYVEAHAGKRYQNLDTLLNSAFPRFEKHFARTGTPSGVKPAHLLELEFILDMHKKGMLHDELKKAAIETAWDNFRIAKRNIKYAQNQSKDSTDLTYARAGISNALRVLDLIEVAEEYYEPSAIPADYDSYGAWKEETIEFSREAALEMKEFFLFHGLALKFAAAKRFHDDGHYIVDTSGYGSLTLPVQTILEELYENGYDISDPDLYKKIGTDIDTFRESYRREREEAMKEEDKHYLLNSPRYP